LLALVGAFHYCDVFELHAFATTRHSPSTFRHTAKH